MRLLNQFDVSKISLIYTEHREKSNVSKEEHSFQRNCNYFVKKRKSWKLSFVHSLRSAILKVKEFDIANLKQKKDYVKNLTEDCKQCGLKLTPK